MSFHPALFSLRLASFNPSPFILTRFFPHFLFLSFSFTVDAVLNPFSIMLSVPFQPLLTLSMPCHSTVSLSLQYTSSLSHPSYHPLALPFLVAFSSCLSSFHSSLHLKLPFNLTRCNTLLSSSLTPTSFLVFFSCYYPLPFMPTYTLSLSLWVYNFNYYLPPPCPSTLQLPVHDITLPISSPHLFITPSRFPFMSFHPALFPSSVGPSRRGLRHWGRLALAVPRNGPHQCASDLICQANQIETRGGLRRELETRCSREKDKGEEEGEEE